MSPLQYEATIAELENQRNFYMQRCVEFSKELAFRIGEVQEAQKKLEEEISKNKERIDELTKI